MAPSTRTYATTRPRSQDALSELLGDLTLNTTVGRDTLSILNRLESDRDIQSVTHDAIMCLQWRAEGFADANPTICPNGLALLWPTKPDKEAHRKNSTAPTPSLSPLSGIRLGNIADWLQVPESEFSNGEYDVSFRTTQGCQVKQTLNQNNDLEMFISKVFAAIRKGETIKDRELVVRAAHAMDISE